PAASAPDGSTNATCHTYMNGIDATGYLAPFCDTLPAGFSTSTINAFGQVFGIQVHTGAIATGATVPSTYSFMIMTSSGDTISDADGGR
ncbi:hypothetical protein ABTF61_19305, partial [Acinetobacter baumannii]